MKQVYDVGGDYLRREEDIDKFMQAMKRAKIRCDAQRDWHMAV
jgi:hypothetical protein